MFKVFVRSIPLQTFAWGIGQSFGSKLIEYLEGMVLDPTISRIRNYFEILTANGTIGNDLLIRQRPTEPWLEAAAQKIFDQLRSEGVGSLYIMTRETVVCLKDEIGAKRFGAIINVRRQHGGIFEVKVCGSTVGTVEPLTAMSDIRSPYSQTRQQTRSRRHNINVETSPYVVFNTTARSRSDSIAYVYPQWRNAVESLAKSGSADDSMMVIGSDMYSSINVPSSVKSRAVASYRDVSAIYICSPDRNSRVRKSADNSAILVSPKH